MRVLYLADAPRLGGAERYLADVIAGAGAAGHDTTLLAPQADLLDYVSARAPQTRLVRAGDDAYARAPSMALRLRALLPAAVRMARAVSAERPDLLHVNNGGYPGSDLCRLVPILARRRPTVMSVHSIPWDRAHSDPRVQAAADRALWPSLDAVAGATRVVGTALTAERGLPPERFRRLPYGMPAPDGDAEGATLRRTLAPDGELLVGMVAATADPGKGHGVLLDAVRRVRAPARAVFVGADPGPRFADEPRVTITGRVPSVGPYLHAIDVLIVPSTQWESLPLVILEAMGAARPVFGSRLAGIPEAIDDGRTGRLFAPGDSEALADALEHAAADRDALRAMGAAGRARWEREFSPERMIDAVLGLYGELARGARGAGAWVTE